MRTKLKNLKSALSELQKIQVTQVSASLQLKEFLICRFLTDNFYDSLHFHYKPIKNLRQVLSPDYEYFHTGLMQLQTRVTLHFDDWASDEVLIQALKSSPYNIAEAIHAILDVPKFDLHYIQTMTHFMNYLPWQHSCKEITIEDDDESIQNLWHDLSLNEVSHYLQTKISRLTEAPPIIDYSTLQFLRNILTELSPAQVFYLIDTKIEDAYAALSLNFKRVGNLGQAFKLAMEQEINNCISTNTQIKSLSKRPISFPGSLFQDFVFTNWIKLSESPFHIPVREEFIKTRLIVA